MATEECQRNAVAAELKLSAHHSRRRRTEDLIKHRHLSSWNPQPPPFSSSIAVYCEMLQSEVSSDARTLMYS